MTKHFTFNIPPVPASRPRVTRWGTYYAKKYTDYQSEMGYLLEDMEVQPYTELLEVEVIFHVAMAKSWSKKKKEEKEKNEEILNI